jgi:glycosyltransferase involved in cell wall biosynthesis
MKIAFVNPEYPSPSGFGHGGIASYIYAMASALAQMGHTVHILVRENTVPDSLPPGISIHTFGFVRSDGPGKYIDRFFRNGTIVWERGQARAIYRLLMGIWKSDGLDIVEFADYSGLAHETKRAPFAHCITFHTPQEIVDELNQTLVTSARKKRYRFESEALATAKIFKSPSEALKRKMCERYGIEAARVDIIRYPIDTFLFDNITKSHFNEDRIDVLFVGRLEGRKGAEIILQSIKKILSIDSRIHLTFVGETDLGDAQSYRDAIERSLSSEERCRVWFIGPVNHHDLPLLYCRSSALFLPSIFDNLPNALLEAMSAKLPVIASDVGGINEILRNGESGLLFNPDNTGQMLDCFDKLVHNKRLVEEISENAYADIKNLFLPERIAEQTIAFYQKSLK